MIKTPFSREHNKKLICGIMSEILNFKKCNSRYFSRQGFNGKVEG